MAEESADGGTGFLKSLGFPALRLHSSFNHFDFVRGGRRILVIGPMGSGKTEYASRVWRDAAVARRKGPIAASLASTAGADRRNVVFVRSALDRERFPDYPEDALAHRSGFERCGDRMVLARDSFTLEESLREKADCGTWIVDEASFFDERLAYLARRESVNRGLVFIFPTLVLNFRREIFNSTARILLDTATDVFPLTAYCEAEDCLEDSYFTYRYYLVEGKEAPAPYFDPLIIVGGDREKRDGREPNYCTRCERHHYLPGKEYSYLTLKPLGLKAARGELGPLSEELMALKDRPASSALASSIRDSASAKGSSGEVCLRTLSLPCLAERALIYLFAEQNLLSEEAFKSLVERLDLDRGYLASRLADNGRPVALS